MAFSCVMYLKDECDGCGACEEHRVPYDGLIRCRISDPYGVAFDDDEEDEEDGECI